MIEREMTSTLAMELAAGFELMKHAEDWKKGQWSMMKEDSKKSKRGGSKDDKMSGKDTDKMSDKDAMNAFFSLF